MAQPKVPALSRRRHPPRRILPRSGSRFFTAFHPALPGKQQPHPDAGHGSCRERPPKLLPVRPPTDAARLDPWTRAARLSTLRPLPPTPPIPHALSRSELWPQCVGGRGLRSPLRGRLFPQTPSQWSGGSNWGHTASVGGLDWVQISFGCGSSGSRSPCRGIASSGSGLGPTPNPSRRIGGRGADQKKGRPPKISKSLITNTKGDKKLTNEQTLNDLLIKWSQCRDCPELKSHIQFPAHCHGTFSSGIMLVSEGAYLKSIQAGRYFTRGFLRDAIPNLEKYCYLTDVIKCDSCGVKSKTLAGRCFDKLIAEIVLLRPKVILAVGALPFEVLTGMNGPFISRHGMRKSFYCNGIEVVPLIHPSRANVYYPGDNPVADYKQSLRLLFSTFKSDS